MFALILLAANTAIAGATGALVLTLLPLLATVGEVIPPPAVNPVRPLAAMFACGLISNMIAQTRKGA